MNEFDKKLIVKRVVESFEKCLLNVGFCVEKWVFLNKLSNANV